MAIIASVVSAGYTSRLLYNRIDLTSLLKATLAGGVSIGTSCDICNNPGYPILIGIIAGIISTLGYAKITPFLKRTINL